MEQHGGGSPTDPTIKWTYLKPRHIVGKLKRRGIFVCKACVIRLLREHNYRKRSHRKIIAIGEYARRKEQFSILFYLMALLNNTDGALISIDTKKKERLGNLYRKGKCYTQQALPTFDHDYSYLGEGHVIPQGILDMKHNKGYISIGTSAETSDFIGDCLLWWWENYGIHLHPDAKEIMILCDSGGANGYRKHLFKKELLRVAKLIGIRIIICHYPPYSSKYNPIEYRLFAQIHHSFDGILFSSYELVKELCELTTTKKGLEVIARIVHKKYLKGQRCKKEELDYSKILFHRTLPKLNYTILP